MKIIRPPTISEEEECPYIKNLRARHHYFFAVDLEDVELEHLLSHGWRKFGWYYFRPECNNCRKCIPIRVVVDKFTPNKNQRRVLKKNQDITIEKKPLIYRKELYDLYVKHSKGRFVGSEISSEQMFKDIHFSLSTNTFLLEFKLNGQLIACGILDESSDALSSVYFTYDPDYSKRSLGIYGALKEIELTQKKGLSYYYLGYWVKENHFMSYKDGFSKSEIMDWKDFSWKELEKK